MEILLTIAVVALLAVLGWLYSQNEKLRHQLTQPKNPANPEWANQSAQTIINSAQAKADAIMTQAELGALKLGTEKGMESQLFEKQFQEKLDQMTTQANNLLQQSMQNLQTKFTNNINQAQSGYHAFVQKAVGQMADSQKQTEENMRTKINELLFKFEENLANFLATSEQKSFEAINLELKSARELIESYKVQQLAIIDENIVSVLEKTLDLVLTEKLSLRNQVDLVYDALYKAKVEKFLV